jgi:hypothetical protein
LQAVAAAADVEAAPPEEVTPSESAPVPDWLRDVAATAEVEAEGFATAPEMAELPPAEEEMPDWLAELTAGPPDVAAQPLAPEEIPGWLQEAELSTAEGAELAPGEVPDWLAEMAPAAGEPELAPDAELPDWLAEMAPPEELPPDTGAEELAPADIPDWLAQMAPPEAAPQAAAEMDVPPAEVPDWLAEAPAEEPVEELAEAAPPPLVAAETPDWLAELAEAADLSMEEAPAGEPLGLEGEEIPDWLAELREEQAPAIPVPEELVGVEEPDLLEREPLVYPEGAGGEVTEAEAELLARLEEMSPEEAFAAWEALLAESEAAEAAVSGVEEAQPEVEAAGPMEAEELAALEPEPLVYPEGAGGEVTEAEAELLARLEEMSPEEAFAAWEALLAESEAAEAAVPRVEEAQPEVEAAGPMEAEAPAVPEPEPLPYPEEAEAKVVPTEAELIAGLEEMSPEEAFAAWEAMLAEGALQEQVLEEAEPAVEPVAEADHEDEGPLAEALEPEPAVAEIEAEPVPEAEVVPEVVHTWVSLTEEEEWEEVGIPGVSEQVPLAEPVAELDQPWMALAVDEELAEVAAPPHAPPVEEGEAVELPDWAVAEAAELAFGAGPGEEEEITLGPNWVWLSAEEEAEIRTAESFEEAALRAEVPFAAPAPSVGPTWVAAEEEAPAVVPVPEAPSAAGRRGGRLDAPGAGAEPVGCRPERRGAGRICAAHQVSVARGGHRRPGRDHDRRAIGNAHIAPAGRCLHARQSAAGGAGHLSSRPVQPVELT